MSKETISEENEMDEEAKRNWEEKMSEPVRGRILTPEEINELREQGRI